MNKLVRGKTSLIILSVSMAIVGLLLTGGSIGLIVWGAKIVSDTVALGVVLIVIGSIMTLLFLSGVVYGIILYITGKSLVALNGSVKEDNLGVGTVNMLKCDSCGAEIEKNEKFCSKCGKELADAKKCTECGVLNKKDAKHCTACGKELN